MSLTFCPVCRAIEGRTREADEKERMEMGVEPDDEAIVCAECDSLEGLQSLPEHDDSEMER